MYNLVQFKALFTLFLERGQLRTVGEYSLELNRGIVILTSDDVVQTFARPEQKHVKGN